MTAPSNPVQILSETVGIPLDLVKTMLLIFASTPLALILRFINNSTIRYAYSLVLGLLYLVYLLQQWFLYVLLVALLPFAFFKTIGKYHYQISLVTSFGLLLFIHIYRFMYDYMGWKIDCSVSVMVMVTKATYYGNYISHHKNNLSFFKFMSYCLFFPSVLIGPTFSYQTFQNFIEKKNGYEKPQIKANLILLQTVQALCLAVATAVLMPIFTPYWALQNQFYLSLSPLMKFLALNVVGVCYRIKFYTAWGFTQIAYDISGLSWNQKQGSYSTVRGGSIRFETQLNPRNKTSYWNTGVQLWLKQIIFDKVVSATKSSGLATFITFLASAIWHGVYLTYYVGFIQWAIIIIISKWAYRMSQALPKLSNSIVAKILAFIVASSLLNYTGMFIVILTWNEALQAYKDMKFIGNILIFVLLFASFIITPKMFKSKHAKDQRHKQKSETSKDHTQ